MRSNRHVSSEIQVLPDQMKKCLGWVVVGVLFAGTVGCSYNGHTNMGDTEKWVASGVNVVPKTIGLVPITAFDSVVSPFTAAGDQIFRGHQYHMDHKYLSYAGSRSIGRSNMGFGYQVVASAISIPIETVWLVVTGPVDLVTVMVWGDDGVDGDGDDSDANS
jgi:hypothetical protein